MCLLDYFILTGAVTVVAEVTAAFVFGEVVEETAIELPEVLRHVGGSVRSSFLNFENASSIGFGSGQYGGR